MLPATQSAPIPVQISYESESINLQDVDEMTLMALTNAFLAQKPSERQACQIPPQDEPLPLLTKPVTNLKLATDSDTISEAQQAVPLALVGVTPPADAPPAITVNWVHSAFEELRRIESTAEQRVSLQREDRAPSGDRGSCSRGRKSSPTEQELSQSSKAANGAQPECPHKCAIWL